MYLNWLNFLHVSVELVVLFSTRSLKPTIHLFFSFSCFLVVALFYFVVFFLEFLNYSRFSHASSHAPPVSWTHKQFANRNTQFQQIVLPPLYPPCKIYRSGTYFSEITLQSSSVFYLSCNMFSLKTQLRWIDYLIRRAATLSAINWTAKSAGTDVGKWEQMNVFPVVKQTRTYCFVQWGSIWPLASASRPWEVCRDLWRLITLGSG